ncbi:MAG: efflux RND transporter periplasmic adaptor subunit [Pyrinomonadaceae bacterium]|nr:efflux RND transporter periplasmic adaptor subunit [Pyrinomonadaceae bacterium]
MSNESMDPVEDQANIRKDNDVSQDPEQARPKNNALAWMITAGVIIAILLLGSAWILIKRNGAGTADRTAASEPEAHHDGLQPVQEVRLEPDAAAAANITTEQVAQRPAVSLLYVTGTVELNPERTEMATPLVGGRIQSVRYGVGDHVERGTVLATISSPQLAQLHGKMHEARTQFELAVRNMERVQRTENRVNVLAAKAKLDEADATLKRTKKLIDLGAGAGKDLVAAEAAYRTAKAEYEFQSNISLNKEIQEAKAAVETSREDLAHIVDEMRSYGDLSASIDEPADHGQDTSLVALRAPISGMVTERRFNAGAGIEANTPVFVISNLGTVYVIANVPQVSVNRLSIGSAAEIRTPSVGTVNGRISFIDPRIDEQTRTARVRLEVPNVGGRLRAGMFTEVGFYTGISDTGDQELFVRSEAVQRLGDQTIVFVPRASENGVFEVRNIEAGADIDGYTRIVKGLQFGESVVTNGSFVLKTQLEKGAIGDDH